MSKLSGSLDANILVRLVTKDIKSQYDLAMGLINSGSRYEVSDTAIIESIYALHEYYKVPRPLVKESIQALMTNRNLLTSTTLFEDALKLYCQRPSLSIEDCYQASLANQHNALPLWTFDKKLAKQSNGLAKELGA